MKLMVNKAFISKTTFLLFMIILFLGAGDYAPAGEMRMDNVTINGQLGKEIVETDKYFKVCANVDGHSYPGKGIVKSGSRLPRKKITTYLRVNDQLVSDKPVIKSGFFEAPVTFSWDVSDKAIEVEHRYSLHPQEDWSKWSKEKSASYFFIMSGNNVFEVLTRYKMNRKWLPGNRTYYRFVLNNPIVANPENSIISKASHGSPISKEEEISLDDIYSGSRALLIGVSNYSNPALPFLPYVKKDIEAMKDVLSSHGFQVEKLNKVGNRNEIMAALKTFVKNTKVNERLLIYFSLHVFHDPVVDSRQFIAPHDCAPDLKNTCILLSEIIIFIEDAITAGVKHLLVIFDACSTGLGEMSEKAQREYFDLPIAVQKGSHMVTAGLPNQETLMDNELEKSYFTHFLAKGLSGEADYTKDGIISLTELLLFVRANVAKESIGKQTPMLSRISGTGEMMFKVSSEK